MLIARKGKRGVVFTIFCDVLCHIFAFMTLIVAWQMPQLRQQAAENTQLKIEVDEASGVANAATASNEAKDEVIEDQQKRFDVLSKRFSLLEQKHFNLLGQFDRAQSAGQRKESIIVDLRQKLSQSEVVVQTVTAEAEESGGQVTRLQTVIAGLQKELEASDLKNEGLAGELAKSDQFVARAKKAMKAGQPLAVVVCIDVTASMSESIEELLTTMAVLTETMPLISAEFRVEILAFRDGIASRFPITRIFPNYLDNGESQQKVLDFIEKLDASHGYTDHEPVLAAALKSLANVEASFPEGQGRSVLMLVGDVGCSELDKVAGFNAAEAARARELLAMVSKWAGARTDRRVGTLYVHSAYAKEDPGAASSLRWFQSLGNVNEPSIFCERSGELLRTILRASFE